LVILTAKGDGSTTSGRLTVPPVRIPPRDTGPLQYQVDQAVVPAEVLTNLGQRPALLVEPDGLQDLVLG
jgi:hypothetical protein